MEINLGSQIGRFGALKITAKLKIFKADGRAKRGKVAAGYILEV